jgi:hypothetical protein
VDAIEDSYIPPFCEQQWSEIIINRTLQTLLEKLFFPHHLIFDLEAMPCEDEVKFGVEDIPDLSGYVALVTGGM